MDVDSNNNGDIEDSDDPIEENNPGKLIGLNDKDDNGNGTPNYSEGSGSSASETGVNVAVLEGKRLSGVERALE